ncbi:MAG: ABC transporter ATP-binding protein [Erysipelotrichaceae bacterium]|nr:ABC transporter ATP-binding protein [Erysipelotrichaceae bacterium]MBQ1740183.1 ABC transporter ATP-binding protein [Erysipelotrichaceae bacterium]MBQ3993782.1 ABC transporter ATP-binding protein [Erysipelotrichaceae bacterium]MBQ5552577.1 ABC transporter ATP-binding protein [Erysipelotrichaceae bacterium]MBR6725134.1 ABC transporter ATP-binding protein [Erysipelotrichaceae bacterium]
MLKIEGLYKAFKDKKVLEGLDLVLNEGSIFGLVGVNGAGKSTLLRCIAGIYEADHGSVLFNGEDTFKNPAVRKDIFFVSDEPYYPIAANIRTMKEFYSSFYDVDMKTYNEVLNLFHLDDTKPISSFSKGMKRQASLLFALSIAPKLLLLDEAFDGLDPIVRHDLKRMLYELIEEQKATIIISSHNLKELEDICDSYGILENGRIASYGDLLESKANLNKYQLAFASPIDESVFDAFDILYSRKEGSVYSFVIRGDRQQVEEKLQKLDPLILDTLPVNFEELFIYEHEGGSK